MKRLLFAFVLVAPELALAGQPISESFVQCAQLVDTSNRLEPDRRGTPQGAVLEYASVQLMYGAEKEAMREGRSNIDDYISGMAALKSAEWDAKGMIYVVSQDFRDWMQYCRKLADNRDISLKP